MDIWETSIEDALDELITVTAQKDGEYE